MKVKVCGMREPENILAVARLAPDFMGFIFYQKSPRYVGTDFQIPAGFPDSVKRVGVFVKEAPEMVMNKIKQHQLNAIQLHGDEDADYCRDFKQKGVCVIKVFRVDSEFDFDSTQQFSLVADYFLFDTKGPQYGGNARAFDWNLLKKYRGHTPFLISGGVNLQNIPAIKSLPFKMIVGVDINSGVEQSPGMKDVNKVTEALKAIRV